MERMERMERTERMSGMERIEGMGRIARINQEGATITPPPNDLLRHDTSHAREARRQRGPHHPLKNESPPFFPRWRNVHARERTAMGGRVLGTYLVLARWLPDIQATPLLFVALYALSFVFANAGPNATTFILPAHLGRRNGKGKL